MAAQNAGLAAEAGIVFAGDGGFKEWVVSGASGRDRSGNVVEFREVGCAGVRVRIRSAASYESYKQGLNHWEQG
jgi:hypothetical protein